MKYIDGFRNPEAAAVLRRQIHALAGEVHLQRSGRALHIMEVCGTHTMAIGRYGIRTILPDTVSLLSGPGCPVCVTDSGYIDAAIALAERGLIICTFGDMVHVPGRRSTLAGCRSAGYDIRTCYSPLEALDIAKQHPEREVVFLGIGFETTIGPVISIVDQALKKQISNVSILTAFKRVIPALHALMGDPEIQIDAFLCPAHVSVVIGAAAYQGIVDTYHIPCVIAGFEPLDILYGIDGILRQWADRAFCVDNQYNRVVTDTGNPFIQALMQTYLQPADASWRGLGAISASGWDLKEEYARFDACRKFDLTLTAGQVPNGCRCGDVIKGKLAPRECLLFGTVCTPSNPVGPCMVSTEGSCAAAYRYG
ncbi:MAG: hydrogenase formation protein HypD [Spartobacteria bacterium]|nr:hydrogenase formation protein HypD [Spartobacteria bacterium]